MYKVNKLFSVLAGMCSTMGLALADGSDRISMQDSSDLSIGANYIWGTAGTAGWAYDAELRYYVANSVTVDLLAGSLTNQNLKFFDYGIGLHYYLKQSGGVSPAPYLVANVLNISGNRTQEAGWQYGIGVDFYRSKKAAAYVQYTRLNSGGETNSVIELGVRLFPNLGGK